MTPTRETAWRLPVATPPSQRPQWVCASSTSSFQSALPANASTMFDGLYRRAK